MGRFDRRKRESGAATQKDKGYGSLVGPLVESIISRHPSFDTNPLGEWRELVGDQVARYCQPRSLKDKILVIAAYDSVWKHHLELHKSALMEKINRERAESLVEKIVVRVGELSESPPPLNPSGPGGKKSPPGKIHRKKKKNPARPLTPEEKVLLKNLPDADLRVIGARLLKRIPESSDQ